MNMYTNTPPYNNTVCVYQYIYVSVSVSVLVCECVCGDMFLAPRSQCRMP